MNRAILAMSLVAAACSTGYRKPEDSRKLRAELDDRTIESRIRVALASDATTRGEPIEIACVDGTVYLRGPIAARSPAGVRARAIAAGVEGVGKVVVRFGADG